MNEMGYLTINSQPAVNGARSDDKVHGWGPAGGYVYQKVSLLVYTRLGLQGGSGSGGAGEYNGPEVGC